VTHRIALIHAVRVAIQPVEEAFTRHWPEAAQMNVLDDSLPRDRARDGELTPAMVRRFAALADYALATALDAGDGATHDRLLADAAPQLADCDAVMLAQFSTARAQAAVAAVLACPVLTSPDSAVLWLRGAVNGAAR